MLGPIGKKNKITCTSIFFFLILGCILFFNKNAAAFSFSDVDDSTAGKQAIYYMDDLDIMHGFPDGTFRPNDFMTRGEFAKLVCKITSLADTVTVLSTVPGPYSDVATDYWANGHINAAAAHGYLWDNGSGSFSPDTLVTQVEAVTVLLRTIGYNDNLPGNWPADYVAKATQLNLLDGITFDFDRNITRGQLAILTTAVLSKPMVKYSPRGNYFDQDLIYRPALGGNTTHTLLSTYLPWADAEVAFSDVGYSPREGVAVYNLSAWGIMDGYPDGTFRPDAAVTRAELARQICILTGLLATAAGGGGSPGPYSDVVVDHWANGYISAAAAQGYVRDNGDGSFSPDASVSQAEALTVLLRAIGYNDNLPGSWPDDYIAQARTLGLLDNMFFDAEKKTPRDQLARWINEILYKPVVEYVPSDGNFVYEKIYREALGGEFSHTLLEDHFAGAGFSYYVTNHKATITDYREHVNMDMPRALVIPSTLGGYPTADIDAEAFAGCFGVTRIAVPTSVEEAVYGAFTGCTGLKRIIFHSPTTVISDAASTIPASATIIGLAGSTAQAYAAKYGRSFSLLGSAATLERIAVTQPAAKLVYHVGDELDISGLEVTGYYSDNSTQVEPITTGNITGFDSSAAVAAQVLTIKVDDKTATYTVQILAAPVDECFIATAAFGSKFDWPVALLRAFRDQYLLTNPYGRSFVHFYYQYSPPLAAIIADKQGLKIATRFLLAPVVAFVYLIYHRVALAIVLVFVFLFLVYWIKLRSRRRQDRQPCA